MDLASLAEDRAGAQETDAGHDLSCDSGRVRRAAKGLEPEAGKQTRADSDQAQGFDPSRVAVELPFDAD